MLSGQKDRVRWSTRQLRRIRVLSKKRESHFQFVACRKWRNTQLRGCRALPSSDRTPQCKGCLERGKLRVPKGKHKKKSAQARIWYETRKSRRLHKRDLKSDSRLT